MNDIANTNQMPGRLGDAERTLLTDPRLDPRLRAALELAGEFAPGVEPISPDATLEECFTHCTAFEAAAAIAHPMQQAMVPDLPHVERSSQTISGVDGNDIELFIHRRNDLDGPAPCIVHTHGGGMVVMSATDPNFVRWRDALADGGLVVVGVEFRNGGGALGNHPFPAGLNDCASAARWVAANRATLGIDKIVISGESGGGNLAVATALQAKRDGWLGEIAGIYAMCPYVSGAYAEPPAELLSLRENDGYMLDCVTMHSLTRVYDPSGDNRTNPLAWPLHATSEDLAGLPPHVVSVNELDPLRDEGLALYRNLLAAGVPTAARTAHGTPHAGDMVFADVVPEVYAETLRSVVGFAKSL
ncbi:MAG: alpha/beta hydrolase fold domain-containing protein [Pseudomonadota bacterium]